MNPNFSNNERAKMEAKLTALLLGELRADEVAALSKAMETDPELAALYERLKVTIELVREVKPAAEQAPLKMSAAKRDKLLASFKTVTPREFVRPRRVMDWLVPVAACAAILAVLVPMVLPSLSRAKYRSQRADAEGRYWGTPPASKDVDQKKSKGETENYAYFLQSQGVGGAVPKEVPAAPPAPVTTLNFVPAKTEDSLAWGGRAAREQVPVAPVLAPPASSTPIILPAGQGGDSFAATGQTRVDGFDLGPVRMDLSTDSDDASKLRVDRGNAVALNGRTSEPLTNGQFVFDVGRVRSLSDESEMVAATNAAGKGTHVAGVVGPEVAQDKWNWTIETHNKVGGVTLADGSAAQVNADGLRKHIAEGTNTVVFPDVTFYDQPVADALPASGTNAITYTFNNTDQRAADRTPMLKDLPMEGRLFRSDSAVAASGEFKTALTKDDMASQVYLRDNAVAVSQPVLGGTVWSSFDGTTNPARVFSNGVTVGEAEVPVANLLVADGSVSTAGATNSPQFLRRYALLGKDLFASNEPTSSAALGGNPVELQGNSSYAIRNSLLNPSATSNSSRIAGVSASNAFEGGNQNKQFVFAAGNAGVPLSDENGKEVTGVGGGRGSENQNSILTTRATQALAGNTTSSFGAGGGGGGGFGGGGSGNFGGGRGRGGAGFRGGGEEIQNSGSVNAGRTASGEKPVELAAANAPASEASGQSRLETKTFRVDPNTVYMGLQNVGTIQFGNSATNTSPETSRNSPLASVPPAGVSGDRGLHYVTGLDTGLETQVAITNFLKAVGVNIDPAKGKSVSFNDRDGTLTVRGTEDDVELVQQAVDTLNTAPPEVTDKTKFAEVNQNDNKQLGFDWYLKDFATNNTGALAASGGRNDKLPALGDLPVVGRLFRSNATVVAQAQTGLKEGEEYVGYDNPGPFVPTIQSDNGGIPLTRPLPLPRTRVAAGSSTKWWNASNSATARGFYDDNLLNEKAVTTISGRAATNMVSVVTLADNNANPYFAAKEELEHAKLWRQTLELKTKQEQTDVNLPRARMVTVMNPASSVSNEKPGLGEKIKETLTGKVERVASIQVDQERPDINVNGIQTSYGSGYDAGFVQSEFEAIHSEAVLGRVVDKLKLDGGDPKKTKAAEEKLKKNLDLRNVKNTKFFEIGVKSEKPEDAARMANAVAEAYRDYRSQEYEELKHSGIHNLEQQLAEQDQKIVVLQAKVDELGKSLPNQSKDVASVKVQKEAEYNQEKALLEKLKAMSKGDLRKALPVAVADGHLNDLLAEYDLAQQALLKLKVASAPDSSKLKNSQALVEDLDRKIDARSQEIMLGLEAKVAFAKSSLDAVTAETKSAGQPDTALPKPTVPPPTPQPEVLTRENAFSTFSLNVSDVSFKLAAASLEKGQMPEPASIRSEEFINAFDYRDPDAAPGVPIAFASERARYPFAHNRELLRFSLKTAAAGRQAGRPLNIVLLLDNSGSMERADRVSIIREALRVLAGQLHAGDTFSIVTFARTAQLRVDGIPGNQAGTAAEEIAKLTPEGGTNLGDAMDLAYETARRHYLASGDNRVVLLTDGAANLGDVNADTLKQKVEAQRQQGIALDCFGIGWEGFNDDLLEVLTRNGDGRYGFINTPEEASTEFVAQIAGALHVAASDVKVQVEFNTNRVTSYRQIGYAKHQLTKEQFRDNTVDAAEIAAQEAGNALYTIEIDPAGSGPIATVRVRYKIPGTTEYREQAWDVPYTGGAVAMDQASPAMRLASTACAFSEWLATSPFAAGVSTDDLLRYMNGVPQFYGADARPAKLEWMIRQAKSVSGK